MKKLTQRRARLVEKNIRLTNWFIVNRGGKPPRMTYDEYISELHLALITAAMTWNKKKGASYSTYAVRSMDFARKACYSRYLRIEARNENPLEAMLEDPCVQYRDELCEKDYADHALASTRILNPRERAVILHATNGLTTMETARRLRVSKQRVSKILLRAREKMRGRLLKDDESIEI
jgi:RNA polymerase sigma factor (sigma-70 family)